MAYQTKDNTGSIFKNNRRQNENHPHMNGKALIGGVWYWVSAWTKEGNSGRFQSLAFQEMTPEQAAKENGGGNTQPRSGDRRAPAKPQRSAPRQSNRPLNNFTDDDLDDIPY